MTKNEKKLKILRKIDYLKTGNIISINEVPENIRLHQEDMETSKKQIDKRIQVIEEHIKYFSFAIT